MVGVGTTCCCNSVYPASYLIYMAELERGYRRGSGDDGSKDQLVGMTTSLTLPMVQLLI